MWNDKRVSVVLMTYAERDSIRAVIDGFFAHRRGRRGRRRRQQRPGRHGGRGRRPPRPGSSTSRGRATATPPGAGWRRRAASSSWSPSRTARSCPPTSTSCSSTAASATSCSARARRASWSGPTRTWTGSCAGATGRWRKLIEVLFNTNHLSDVGCTYRCCAGRSREHVARSMTVGGSHAGVEIMLLAITSGARMVEVPAQLPAARGRLLRHRQPPRCRPRRAADDAADPARPAPQPAPADAAARVHRRAPAAGGTAHEQLPL